MCVLSIKVLIRKKSGNLLYAPRIHIYTYILKSVYLDNKLLFRQVLLKTMERCLLFFFFFVIFLVFLLFFWCRDPMARRLSHIFCLSTFDHTFGHQGSCSLSWQFSLSFIVLNIFSVFILKESVGKLSAFCYKTFSWKGFNKYIFCWMSFLMELVILVIKNVQYVGTLC